VDRLLAHPLLDGGQVLSEAETMLVSLVGGPDLTIAEVQRVMDQINRRCENAHLIMGAAIDEAFAGRLGVTVIASRHGTEPVKEAVPPPAVTAAVSPLDSQLLGDAPVQRRPSRFAAPAPELPEDKREELLTKQTGRRKSASRLRQATLSLEIVSKGRFEKSEPTIHKGEDLDVPTFIRRGVALN
jgi:cell division protein FtsZ